MTNQITYIERVLGQLTASTAGTASTQNLDLPREHLYNRLFLRLDFPTSSSANYVANTEDLAITKIEIIANGQLVIKSYSFLDLVNLTKYQNAVTAVDKSALAADKVAKWTSAIIDFSLTRKDLATLLPSYKFSSLQLKVSYDAFGTWGGDAAIPPVLTVMSRELLYTGDVKDTLFAINKEVTIGKSAAATGYTEFDLPIGNIYRRIYCYQQGGATAATAQNDTTTDMEVVQDGVIYHKKITFLMNQVKDKMEYHLETKVTGVSMLGLDSTGDGGALVDSAAFSSWKLRLNVPSVANAVVLRVIPQELIYPRG